MRDQGLNLYFLLMQKLCTGSWAPVPREAMSQVLSTMGLVTLHFPCTLKLPGTSLGIMVLLLLLHSFKGIHYQ